jgi:hypothetical protein
LPLAWLSRIDQSVPNQFIISWTIDDLIFEGRAFWLIESRSADGFPMSFTRLPAAMVQTLDQQGEVYFGPSKQVIFNGVQLDPRDLIQFISPMQSLNTTGARAVEIALRIEESRLRASCQFCRVDICGRLAASLCRLKSLSDLAAQFNLARTSGNNTAALNEFLEYVPTTATPDKMLMIESADYSARDLGRHLRRTVLLAFGQYWRVLVPVQPTITDRSLDLRLQSPRGLHHRNTVIRQCAPSWNLCLL